MDSPPAKRSQPPKEFKDFQDLAEKLLAVPKKEVDEKKVEHKRARKKKKAKAKRSPAKQG